MNQEHSPMGNFLMCMRYLYQIRIIIGTWYEFNTLGMCVIYIHWVTLGYTCMPRYGVVGRQVRAPKGLRVAKLRVGCSGPTWSWSILACFNRDSACRRAEFSLTSSSSIMRRAFFPFSTRISACEVWMNWLKYRRGCWHLKSYTPRVLD